MKNRNITICDAIIHPGEQASLALPLPEIFSCAPMYMPVKVLNGKEEGPCVVIVAAMFGNELNGAEIVNRLLKSIDVNTLSGAIIAIPVMNVYGFINRSEKLPGGGILDRSFPGAPTGSHAARLAHTFCTEIFSQADYCIDLRTGLLNYSNLPQVFIGEENPEELKLAQVFGSPVISAVKAKDGSLRRYALTQKVPYLIYEAGEAMRFDEQAISFGVQGILNVLQYLNMLCFSDQFQDQCSFIMQDSRWICSSVSGISQSDIRLGQKVSRGDILSIIKDPFGVDTTTELKAPFSGVVVSVNNLPLVYEGVALFQLAAFEKLSVAASHFEEWLDAEYVV